MAVRYASPVQHRWRIGALLAAAWLALPLAAACTGTDTTPRPGDGVDEAAVDGGDGATQDDPVLTRLPDAGEGPVEDGGDPDAATSEAAPPDIDVFDDSVLRTYDLVIADRDLALLDADPAGEQYVPGTFGLDGVDYGAVGVRYKGSAGAFNGCVEYPDHIRPSGRKTCKKLSIKVSFNWQSPGGRFSGLKKLLFHAMKNDPSLVRERLGYSTYREAGVPASRAVHALLRINGEHAGLYALVEEVDSRFTRDRFAAEGGNGNLYKEVWPIHGDEGSYIDALRSNRDQVPPASAARMVALANELGAASDPELPAVIERWMDRGHMMSYIAVDRAIRHDDGMLHWWCVAGNNGQPWNVQRDLGFYRCGNHNYYWYEESAAARVWLIPWDLDGVLWGDGHAVAINWEWDDTGVDCSSTYSGNLGRQWPPACDGLTRGWGTFQDDFRAAVGDVLAGPFSDATVGAKLNRWVAQLRQVVEQGLVLDEADRSVSQWLDAVDAVRDNVDARRALLEARIAP